jgi:nucleotide-binding universal stress UspA family protein
MRLDDVEGPSVATAVALAKETGAEVHAVAVVRVPRRFPLEGPLPADVAAKVDAALGNARGLGETHGVVVTTDVVRARSLGHAILDEARAREADLIVLGSSPRWRKRSHPFSPTADFVRSHARCEVVVVPPREGGVEG